jgi:hypothetical protein
VIKVELSTKNGKLDNFLLVFEKNNWCK